MALTLPQRRVLNTLVEYVDEWGYPPTVRTLGGLCGYTSPSTTHWYLRRLERAGYVVKDPRGGFVPVAGKVRTLRVTG